MCTPFSVDWSRSLVVVLSPDAFLRGVGYRIMDEVLAAGYQEVAARVVQPGKPLLDGIYEDLASRNISFGTYRYRALDTLYRLGSSLAIVLSGERDIHERLAEMKGTGPLERAAESSIRRRYRAVNTILSLLHTSDNAQEAELDWRMFFAREWANVGRTELPDSHSPLSSPGARVLAGLLDSAPGAHESRGFFEVRDQFRRIVLAHLWELLPAAEAAVLAGDLAAAAGRPLDDELVGHIAKCLAGRVDLLVRRALSSSFDPDAAPLDAPRLWRLLAGLGVNVDPWSRAVLSTSQYFQPVGHDPLRPSEQPPAEADHARG